MEHQAKNVFNKVKKTVSTNPDIKAIIPFISVGECINTAIQEDKQDKIEKLLELIKPNFDS